MKIRSEINVRICAEFSGSMAGKATISAVMCTQQATNQPTWLALRTAEGLINPAQFDGPEATFIAQLAFWAPRCRQMKEIEFF